MPAPSDDIRVQETHMPGEDRTLDVFLAEPAGDGADRPALIVVHEIWGLDDHIREVARRFARQGYVAVAPDLYTGEWRQAMSPDRIMAGMMFLRQAPPDIQRDPSAMGALISERSEEEERALKTLMRVMSPDQRRLFAMDLKHVLQALGARRGVAASRLASLGFCMGGGITARLATLAPELKAAVIFYGENPPLQEVPKIQAKVLGLYGGEDARITETVPAFEQAMRSAGKSFRYHVYPGAKHAFFNDTRPSFHAEAAGDAWGRVLGFLEETLGETGGEGR